MVRKLSRKHKLLLIGAAVVVSVLAASALLIGGESGLLGGAAADHEPPDEATHIVIFNEVGMYAAWPAHDDLPPGWKSEGFEGTLAECEDYIAGMPGDLISQAPEEITTAYSATR
ncbi:MAG: MbtH family NRPS accessory protein [Chloroflexi bacterium]|nr:MbtH family NRPS accessory protein [Chloroflexota bacterium]